MHLRKVLGLALSLLAMALPVHGATLTVDTFVDEFDTLANSTCSLREAVEATFLRTDFGGCAAEGDYGTDHVILLEAGTYGLTRAPIDPLRPSNETGSLYVRAPTPGTDGAALPRFGSVEIRGAGAQDTVIRRMSEAAFGVLWAETNTVTRLFDLTIAGGDSPSGGGVFATGFLSTERVILRDNRATLSGGGFSAIDQVEMTNTWVTGNRVDVESCSDGRTHGGGGFVLVSPAYFSSGRGRFDGVTFSDNVVAASTACPGFGGGLGIFVEYYDGIDLQPEGLEIINSTFSGNRASVGGGVDILFDPSIMRFPRPPRRLSASAGLALSWTESGVAEVRPSVTFRQVTLTANTADAAIGGLSLYAVPESAGGRIVLNNTVIADNAAPTGPDCSRLDVAVLAENLNLLGIAEPRPGDASCLSASPYVGTFVSPLSALLEPLADNGGFTPTHLPSTESPVIDAAGDGELFDQRGVTRPLGAGHDLGAVETLGSIDPHTIPTLSEWALLLLAFALAGTGILGIRRS